MKPPHFLYIPFLAILIAAAADTKKPGHNPPEGYVPNKETAIRIAVAVWIPIYGANQINSEKPYQAELKGDVWTVKGSLWKPWYAKWTGYELRGGVAEAEIAKSDGRILRVIHGK